MALFGAKSFRIDVEGGQVPCITFGTGERDLVILPGLRFSSIEKNAAAAAFYFRIFAKEFRVFVIDRKEPLEEGCTIHDLAEDTVEAMRNLGIEYTAVYGASQGGMIAQDLAIHHPEMVEKLVLGVTAGRTNTTIEAAVHTWIELMDRSGYEAVAKDYAKRGYSEKYMKRYRFLLPVAVKLQKKMPKERFLNLARACLTCDTYRHLSSVRCPVFVIGGGRDRIVSGAASLEIAEKLGCECYLYRKLSHEAYNEAKDFNRRVYGFLIRDDA